MATTGYVFDIGGGVAYACQACHDITERDRAEREAQGFDVPEFYGPTTLDGDAVCDGCVRRISDTFKGS